MTLSFTVRVSTNLTNLYIHRNGGTVTLVVLYVDDLIITDGDANHIAVIKAALSSAFEMTDLGLLHFFLGLEVC